MIPSHLLLETLKAALMYATVASGTATHDQPPHLGADDFMQFGVEGVASSVTIQNLDPKFTPAEVQADDNKKDVSVKGRRTYKPAKKSDNDYDPVKRLLLKAKKDGGAATIGASFEHVGDSSASMLMSIDKTKGLVDGQTLGFLDVIHTLGEDLVPHRVQAVWNAGIDGFTVSAVADGVGAGSIEEFPGARELRLGVEQFGTDLTLTIEEPGDDFDPGFFGPIPILQTTLPEEGLTYCGTFGAEGLNRKAQMYWVDLRINADPGGSNMTSGELQLISQIQGAGLFSGNAEIFSDPHGFLNNLDFAKDYAGFAVFAWNAAQIQLDALIADGTLTGKKAKLLKASIKKGKKNNEKAHKLLCKLVDKGKGQGDSSSAAEHLAQNARNFADLATAQVFGVTTRHTDHVYDWFDW
jgi:hypothetical protein